MEAFQLHKGIPAIHSKEPEDVHIFFSLMEGNLQPTNSQQLLDAYERERLSMYRTDGKRNEFLFGRLFMRELLGEMLGISPADVPIAIDEHKRPFLIDQSLQFNLSHSFGGFALIASFGYEVGIDIEYRKRNISLEDGKHVFMPAEKTSMEGKDTKAAKEEFLHRWTLKEAIYKAAKLGTQLVFNSFELEFEPLRLNSHSSHLDHADWKLGHAYPHADYIIAFALKNTSLIPPRLHLHQILL